MRNVITENELDVLNNQKFNAYLNLRDKSEDFSENNAVSEIMTASGCENFLKYIKKADPANDQGILLPSPQSNFYNYALLMRNISTVINLTGLNLIKGVQSFLLTIFSGIPFNTNFKGCFIDNRKLIYQVTEVTF
jgi:hypothetical protein